MSPFPQATRPLVDQKETGDGHTIVEEYRGYILDGGGLDGAGLNGHTGGHIRLDPSRKEILVEVDRAAVLNNLPDGPLPPPPGLTDADRLKHILNGASSVFSNADRGAGIFVYYLFDELSLDLPANKLNSGPKQRLELAASRDTSEARQSGASNLKSDFIHVLFVDDSEGGLPGSDPDLSAFGGDTYDLGLLNERGSVLAISTCYRRHMANPAIFSPAKFDEQLMTMTAHELTHLLFEQTAGSFDKREHTTDPNANGLPDTDDFSCLMYHLTNYQNRILDMVKFFPVVQQELRVRNNQGIQ